MKHLVYKLALLSCASTCLVGMAQASDSSLVHFTQVAELRDIACNVGSEARYADYQIKNSGPTAVNLVFNLKDLSSDQVIFYDISCASDVGDQIASGTLGKGESCTISLAITPPECAGVTLPFSEIINGSLTIDTDTRQGQVSTPIEYALSILGSAADFALLSGNDLLNGTGTVQVGSGDVGSINTPSSSIAIYDGSLYTGADNLVVLDALSDAAGALSFLESQPCVGLDFSLRVITPGFHCVTTITTTLTGNYELTGGANDLFVFISLSHSPTINSGVSFTMSGGAQEENVFWIFENPIVLTDSTRFVGTVISTADINSTGPSTANPADVVGRLITTTTETGGIHLSGNSIQLP